MISLDVMLLIFVVLFAIIGAMRGWAKEMLVTFSVILAMFALNVLQTYVPFFKDTFANGSPKTVFWLQTIILSGLVFLAIKPRRFRACLKASALFATCCRMACSASSSAL